MPPDPDLLFTMAGDVLQAVVDHYADAGVSLPGRQYVSSGGVAWDCEQVVVAIERTYGVAAGAIDETLESHPRMVGHTLRSATAAVSIVRCAPEVDEETAMPSIVNEEAVAEIVLRDAMLIPAALIAAERRGDLRGCHGLVVEGWDSAGPEGALVGGVLRARLAIGF